MDWLYTPVVHVINNLSTVKRVIEDPRKSGNGTTFPTIPDGVVLVGCGRSNRIKVIIELG